MTMNGQMKPKKKMEQKVSIEGLENRRYSINTSKSRNSYNITISIQIRKELMWKGIFSECFIITDKSVIDVIKDYTRQDLEIMLNTTNINKFNVVEFDEFEIVDMLQDIETHFNEAEMLKNKIMPKIKKIEEQIKGINSVGYEEED
jgi:hypothetical protein